MVACGSVNIVVGLCSDIILSSTTHGGKILIESTACSAYSTS